MARPTHALIDLASIKHNLTLLKEIAGDCGVIAVVKADAYGNGAVAVAQSIQAKVEMFAVAFLEEALELRQAGITKPIVILQGAHEEEDFALGQIHNLIWLLHSEWQVTAYAKFIENEQVQANAWFKFDTGMHRLGFSPDFLPLLMANYTQLINANTVIVTHIASADEPNQAHAQAQISRFQAMLKEYKLAVSIANSAMSIRCTDAHQDFVRLGIALYGSSPFQTEQNLINLNPVMSLQSEIMALRTIPKGDVVGYGGTWRAPQTSVIATIPLGYADGYPRHAPTGTPAWCNGQLIPLIGRVSMDMLTFDVTALTNPQIGDKVQLWGDKLPINDVANHIGTIAYELMTRVSKRVPRIYTNK